MKRLAGGLILLAILVCSARLFADGARFYVSPTGNDKYLGTLERPWRTIGRAADVTIHRSTADPQENTSALATSASR